MFGFGSPLRTATEDYDESVLERLDCFVRKLSDNGILFQGLGLGIELIGLSRSIANTA
jgi:hypothetical protein